MSRVLAMLLAACAATAAEGGLPGAGPLPRAAPQAPGESTQPDGGEDDLSLRLDREMRLREERIQAILRAGGSVRPVAPGELGPGLEQPRVERERALAELKAAVDEWLGRTHSSGRDVLDAGSPPRQAVQVSPLTAANRLGAAECLRDLALAETVAAVRTALIEEGLAELATLPPELPAELQPRRAWLEIFFLAESARTTGDAAARADRAARARAAAAAFPTAHPDSDLAPAVAALVAGLP